MLPTEDLRVRPVTARMPNPFRHMAYGACAVLLAVALHACSGSDSQGGARRAEPRYPAEMVEAVNRAVGLMGRFEFEEAAGEFRAISSQPDAPAEARLNLAIAVLNQSREGAQDEAMEILRALLASKPDDDIALRARYCLGLCELYLGNAPEAVPQFVAVAEARGTDPCAQYFAGQALEQVGEIEDALKWYEAASERDGYLKSAVLGIQRCARRLGQDARAEAALALFERLAANPRARNVEFKYTRMGDLGMAMVLADPARPAYEPKAGPVFLDPAPLAIEGGDAIRWSTDMEQHASTVDLDRDGRLDLVISRGMLAKNADGALEARTLVLLGKPDGGFRAVPEHTLSSVAGGRVNSILFGDIDGDGRTDAYVCRSGGNVLALQDESGSFRDATASWNAAGSGGACVDGALADLDHDGDLDVFLAYREESNALLASTGTGSFRALGEDAGIASGDRAARSVVVGDFDDDGDADILVINDVPPHQLLLNDRLWKWSEGTAPGISQDQLDDIADAAAVVEIADLPLRRVVFANPNYLRLSTRTEQIAPTRGIELGVADATGDGHPDLFLFGTERIAMHDESMKPVQEFAVPQGSVRTQLVMLEPQRGPHMISMRTGAAPLLWAPGPARGPYVALSFSGRIDPSQSMRSNESGIGTAYALRVGTEWFGGEAFRAHTGRGQSLAPVAVGTGPFAKADLVEVEWSDGVLQSEIDLQSGRLHALVETQRQISSCPVLYAWNGTEHRFVTDLLGVGGVGYLLEPGVYSPPRMWETFVLPPDALAPRADGALELSLGEPMEEHCGLDQMKLLAVDLPPGWDIAPDERLAIGGPEPTGGLVAWSTEWLPIGNATLEKPDLLALEPGEVDPRFIGRLLGEHVVEVTFDVAIDSIPDPWLVIDGWVEYPYCQTMFAAWQAGAKYIAPNLEARAPDGTWVELLGEWGYPAGMPRRMAVPVPKENLPVGTTTLRLRTNMEIYFDSMRLVAREGVPHPPQECALVEGRLGSPGFARRTTGPQKQPFYDHASPRPLWDCRFQRGIYTAFGDVRELLAREDGAAAIFGPGEEVFARVTPPPQKASPGTSRRYVLEVRGWCKDMDLFTLEGETVEPIPMEPADAEAAELMRRTRTRPAGGR